MAWNELTTPEQVEEIVHRSETKPQVIFKHSRRCSLSSLVLSRLERTGLPPSLDFHFIDLIQNRQISNHVAEAFGVWHESPQILVIRHGECVYDESHMAIHMDEILKQAKD